MTNVGGECTVFGPKKPKIQSELHKIPMSSIVVLVISFFSNCKAVDSHAHIFCQPRKLTVSLGETATAAKAQAESLS
eukprot:621492-Pyramimonas_sp.AAC.1